MIDAFLDDLGRRLVASRRRRARIVGEVRDHLDEAADHFVAHGEDRRTAEAHAVGAFGHASDLAGQINAQVAAASLRRVPMIMAAAGTAVVAGFVSAASAQPRHDGAAASRQQVAFFVAVLGLQFAVVAGVRVVARIAAVWGATPSDADQALVRRASLVFLGGLVVCIAGWTVALVGSDVRRHTTPVVGGAVVMLLATIIATVATLRRRVVPIGVAGSAPGTAIRSRLAIAERAITMMGRRPSLTCAAVALVAAASAMSHAETTVGRALPWGVAEAAAVVAGFVLLGPCLEVRSLSRSR